MKDCISLKSRGLNSVAVRLLRLNFILVTAWLALLLAPVAMVIGHTGTDNLNWIRDHISTYAAHAPHANWITASIFLSALGLGCMGISIGRDFDLGKNYLGQIGAMLLGAVVSGLGILATFKETAPTHKVMLSLDYHALRQQIFHESGLLIFFYSATAVALIVGLAIMLKKTRLIDRMTGGIIAATGPGAMVAMSHFWLKYLGIAGKSSGIRQRASFLCLWFGALLVLALLTKDSKKTGSPESTDIS